MVAHKNHGYDLLLVSFRTFGQGVDPAESDIDVVEESASGGCL